ncbi:hypothetical protein PCANB_001789 [Pneumocystis canis]|nr:hypothetical protein PCANB_001789 [Pneumocystis canis]
MEEDYYDLLGISPKASDAAIHKGYRRAALQYHPDKNSEATAIKMFHKISLAFEILSNPTSRMEYDRSREALLAKKQKYEALNLERKRMVQVESMTEMEATLRKLQEEGTALRKKREASLRAKKEMFEKKMAKEDIPNLTERKKSIFTMEDRTIKVRWRRDRISLDKNELQDAFQRFGKIEHIILKNLVNNSKKKKLDIALIVFESVVSAHAAVDEASLLTEIPFIYLKDVLWAKQAPDLTKIQNENQNADQITLSPPNKSSFLNSEASFLHQNSLDYENIILMRMREAEREKLGKKTD